MMRETWQERFMELAHHVAGWSRDPSTQVGAVIVRDKRVLGMGYNGFPRGVNDHDDRYEHRETKYGFVVHAERNAMDNATVDLTGAVMYVTLSPCRECMKGIIQKGISMVIYKEYRHDDFTAAMSVESGVPVISINSILGGA